MNYTKPEVAVLGNAVSVIAGFPLIKGPYPAVDSRTTCLPAYDLDE